MDSHRLRCPSRTRSHRHCLSLETLGKEKRVKNSMLFVLFRWVAYFRLLFHIGNKSFATEERSGPCVFDRSMALLWLSHWTKAHRSRHCNSLSLKTKNHVCIDCGLESKKKQEQVRFVCVLNVNGEIVRYFASKKRILKLDSICKAGRIVPWEKLQLKTKDL